MLRIGPYSAWVVVDDAGLETHCTEASHNSITTSVTGWISSEAGKRFSVYWHNAVRDVALEAIILIDGVECNRHVMLTAHDFPDRPDIVWVSCTRTSKSTRRDFIFSITQVTDDDEYSPSIDYTKLVVITLELWRLRVNRVVRQQLLHDCYEVPTKESQILHEQTKRGGTHQVRFGEEYNVSRPTVDMVDGQKMDRAPYASFSFKYRPRGSSKFCLHYNWQLVNISLDMLLAQGVIAQRIVRPLPISRLPSTTAPTAQVFTISYYLCYEFYEPTILFSESTKITKGNCCCVYHIDAKRSCYAIV
ncbi:hypothetical protein J3R30DRAFT_3289646 [Lentinula aciculospora]|uniref:DUF7918 domain-containing protein n=1 Tax=Lentinula aciculospora TaxID=153920 RepID=A0A9W9ABW2_9AGAR|nr:hypothetical protein J3R30DRAFT_3289646 [Lentinula aciculospora]